MTEPITEDLELLTQAELIQRVQDREQQLEELRTAMETREAEYRVGYEQQQELLRSRPTQDTLDAVTAERNTAQQQLAETEQERARLYLVLQDTVQGVQAWVPDLTPVPAPPADLEPAVAEAWVRDQIGARRAQWDSFVHRVVTQASV